MLFDKQQVLSMIKDPQQAQQAAQQLPDQVDHEQHGDMLQQFGVDPNQLAAGAGGGQGGGDPGMGGYQEGTGGDPGMGGQSGMGGDPGTGDDPGYQQ